MNNKVTMKLGYIGFVCTPPKEITEPLAYLKWQVDRLTEMGGSVLHVASRLPADEESRQSLKEYIDSRQVQFEFGGIREIFGLAGPNAGEIRESILAKIRTARFFGCQILREGYGSLSVETSRFNRQLPVRQHLQRLIDSLKEAARIFDDQGMLFAIENHCDFTGRQIAEVVATVDSPAIGVALDTGNGFVVCSDPDEDVEVLAPYTFTTHIKDMKVVDFPSEQGLVPFQARGCAVGDGNVDIPQAIELLDRKCPRANGLHLVIEQGWLDYETGIDKRIQSIQALEKGMKYLKSLLH